MSAGREAWLVNAVVDSFTESHSVRCLEILAAMNEPHDKVRRLSTAFVHLLVLHVKPVFNKLLEVLIFLECFDTVGWFI